MTKHFQKGIEQLKKRILSLSAAVEERVRQSVQAILERDANLGRKVVETDVEIDEQEVEIEEECLKLLALYQPVAVDLRMIIAILKINNDLERIGDLAVNLAETAEAFAAQSSFESPIDFRRMSEPVRRMLRESIDALVRWDADLARRVCAEDDEVDELHRQAYGRVERAIREHPERAGVLIRFLAVSRYLERIADHATNIAEDVIYLVEGEIRRHRIR